MFHNLIESGSHTREIKRRGSFFVGTLAFYLALVAVAGVGSIYAYNVQLDEQETDMITMLRFAPAQFSARPPEPRAVVRHDANRGGSRAQPLVVKELSIQNPNLRTRQVASVETPEVNRRILPYVQIGTENSVPATIGIPSDKKGDGNGHNPTGVHSEPRVLMKVDEDPPERIVKKETPPTPPPTTPRKINLTSSILSGKAISKPAPVYSKLAKDAHAQGAVAVQILVDEGGRVVSAQATSGHPLLKSAAVQAALQARFSPTVLNGQPVKVSGIITYNFVLQ